MQLDTTSFAGAGDELVLAHSGSGLTFTHHGAATTLTLTLSALGPHSAPATFRSGPLHLGAHANVRVSGIHWSALTGAALRIRIGARTLVVHNHYRAPRLAKVRSLVAKKAGKGKFSLNIAATVRHRLPAGAQLVFSWVVRRAGHELASHALALPASHRSASFLFTAHGRGTYALSGSVAVVSTSRLASASAVSSRRITFHY